MATIDHQGALLVYKRGFFSAVCGPIRLILGWLVQVGHIYLATRLRPDLSPGVLLESKKGSFSAICGPIWLRIWWMIGVDHSYQMLPSGVNCALTWKVRKGRERRSGEEDNWISRRLVTGRVTMKA